MTKGRAMLTLAAASEGWTERPQVIREFHFLGWAKAINYSGSG
jgi:hypothetical protein